LKRWIGWAFSSTLTGSLPRTAFTALSRPLYRDRIAQAFRLDVVGAVAVEEVGNAVE
jgi:hypothetical protein